MGVRGWGERKGGRKKGRNGGDKGREEKTREKGSGGRKEKGIQREGER